MSRASQNTRYSNLNNIMRSRSNNKTLRYLWITICNDILKEKSQIATESFEYHENLANFIVRYLSDFLLNWYVRHGVGKLKSHTLRKIQKIKSSSIPFDLCYIWGQVKFLNVTKPYWFNYTIFKVSLRSNLLDNFVFGK